MCLFLCDITPRQFESAKATVRSIIYLLLLFCYFGNNFSYTFHDPFHKWSVLGPPRFFQPIPHYFSFVCCRCCHMSQYLILPRSSAFPIFTTRPQLQWFCLSAFHLRYIPYKRLSGRPLTLQLCFVFFFFVILVVSLDFTHQHIIRSAFSVLLAVTRRSTSSAQYRISRASSHYYPALVYRERSRPLEFSGPPNVTFKYFQINSKPSTARFFEQYENHKSCTIVCVCVCKNLKIRLQKLFYTLTFSLPVNRS